jgi:hypothetical protein
MSRLYCCNRHEQNKKHGFCFAHAACGGATDFAGRQAAISLKGEVSKHKRTSDETPQNIGRRKISVAFVAVLCRDLLSLSFLYDGGRRW